MQFNEFKLTASCTWCPTREARNMQIEMKNTNLWENLCPNDTQSFSIRTYKKQDLFKIEKILVLHI